MRSLYANRTSPSGLLLSPWCAWCKTILFILFVFLLFPMTFGQTVSGKIQEENEQPIPYANILLMRSADSVMVKGVISDEEGNFELQAGSTGPHYLRVSVLGYEDYVSEAFPLTASSEISFDTIILKAGIALEEVTVSGKRPLFEKRSDRMVINVQSSEVAVGSSANEILSRSPGIIINEQNSAITINGKTGVNLLINGRMINIPEDNVLAYLSGINANNIEKIEVLSSPPANVDAQGNAGFINITLRSGQGEGFDGSLALAGGIGTGLQTANNLSLNYRKNKWAISAFYNLDYNEQDQRIYSARSFPDNSDQVTFETLSLRFPSDPMNTLNLAFDFDTEKIDFGGIVNLNTSRWVMDATNTFTSERNSAPVETILSQNYERNQRDRLLLNSYITYHITDQQYLSLNANYIHSEAENPTTYDYTFFDAGLNPVGEQYFKNFNDSKIDIYTAGLDYHLASEEVLSFDLGTKVTLNTFTNDFEINEVINDVLIPDPGLTNESTLDEWIYAGYINGNYNPGKKFSMGAGLRYEYTSSELNDILTGPVVDRTYGYFFPSITLNYALKEEVNLGLSYTERINRPSFWNLAPFFIFLDPDTFITGNPSTQPSRLKNIELTFSKGERYLSLSYNHTKDPISSFTERFDQENNRNFFVTENLDYARTAAISAGIPFSLGNRIKLQNTVTYQYNEVKDNPQNFGRSYSSHSVDLNSIFSYNPNETLSAEIIYNFFGPKYWSTVNFFKSFHRMDLSIQKKIGKRGGTIGFKLLDIWNDFFYEWGADYPESNYRSSFIFDASHTTWQLTYVLNFGQSGTDKEKRKTGAEEDLQRLNN